MDTGGHNEVEQSREQHRVFDWRYASIEGFLDIQLKPSAPLVQEFHSVQRALIKLLKPRVHRSFRFIAVAEVSVVHPHSRKRQHLQR